ncbi:Nitroimidazol reductase NimA, pyridoxamine 5'-phosphate oxidase superfamily [Pedococcus dokdonensis]|uniref:Nitroimidazol reductase NimA, pyridoxamine 5'-phosphate oxidase superfamily n=1 Tax=Pedococcus dokdonensis TaxID=443156 RepID=A0A1H0NAV3_9MICO|nr:pyridoxamine 5'-phosphate oxidase family protein [Pedococcus dokdonensis]SDO89783.1 Nitroimidazol reductase NimA, pyridoxamine 5'-phosphate oxidase superfamily [Pedococcus dokdonensis]
METNTQLTVAQCWTALREGVVGRVAVLQGQGPDIFPVNYAVDHGTVVFRTGTGTLFTSSDGTFVAFEVDGYDTERGEAWSVVARGFAHEVYELDDALEAMRLPLYPWHDGPKPRIMRIHPDSVTGRRFAVRGGHRTGRPITDVRT